MNLEFFVSDGCLTYKGGAAPVALSPACDTITIDFDEPWKDLVKVVVFTNGKSSAQLLYTGKAPVPRQVCGRGELRLLCYGYGQLGDEQAVLSTKEMVRPVKLLGERTAEAEFGQPVTLSLLEQVVGAAGRALAASVQAEALCEELLELKESGAFRGQEGLPGQAATVTVTEVRHGESAKVENLGTDRNAVLRFTLPYKLTEAEKLEVLGDLEEVIDHILELQQALLGGEEP